MISMVVPILFQILLRSLVALMTNKHMNFEVIPISLNESMKHGFNDVKRQFMSCLIPVHCTYNILIISKESNMDWSGEKR